MISALLALSLVGLALQASGARGALAEEAEPPPVPCITPVQPPRLVLGNANAGVRLTNGADTTVDTSVVGDARGVLVQVVASSADAPATLHTSLPGGGQRRDLLTLTGQSGAAMGLVPLAGNSFVLSAATDVDVRLRVFGVVRGDCFEWVAPVSLLGSSSGVEQLTAGSEAVATLVRPDFLPKANLSSAVALRLRATGGAASVEVATADGGIVATHALAAGEALDVVEPLPPTASGAVVVRASGGPVEATATALGWFRDATSYHPHRERLVASPQVTPVLPVTDPLYDPDLVALPTQARDAVAVILSVRVATTAGAGGSAKIWPTGYAQPDEPTVSVPSPLGSTEQTVVVRPGTDGSLWVEATPGTNWSVYVLGWSSNPDAVNAVADNVTVAAPGEAAFVAPPAADDPDVRSVVEYTGPDPLAPGDVLVSQASDTLPDGLLSLVTAVRSAQDGTQVVETEAASLFDLMPSGEVSGSVSTDSGESPPVEEPPPAPSDSPPDETTAASASTGDASASPSSRATGIGGGIPGRARVQCTGGVGAEVSTSLRLSGSLNLQASWRPWNTVTADFGFSGSVAGEIRAWVGAKASCSGTVNLDGPKLPTFHVPIGPLWVPVSPQVSLQIRLSGEMEAGITASARAEAGVSAGVRYANGGFTPYFSPWFNASAGVDAKAYAQASLEVTPRVTFKLYHAVGPYIDLGAFAEARVEPSATPWWKVDAGVRVGVGLRLDVWKIRVGYDAGRRELIRRRVAQAGSGYPGPAITAGSLPSGQVGTFYDRLVPSQGGAAPLRWYRLSGSTPPGLTFRQDGHLVGTPTTSGTWTFRVRAIDAAGYRSTGDRDIGIGIGMPAPTPSPTPTQTTPPPGPAVTVSKGASAVGLAGCSHSSCRWLDVSVTRFAPSTRVTIVCRASNGDEGGFYTYFKTTDGAGNGWWPGGSGGGCYYGFPGRQVWVTVNGVESNRITW